MELDIEKESIEAIEKVLENTAPVSGENAGSSSTSTNRKKHSKSKKRDSTFLYGNDVAEILKSNQSPELKLETITIKYSEMVHANRKLMMAYKMAEGRIGKMQQENELCQQQKSKAVLARSRLENLCRELQKLNKAQKEEIDLKLRLEEEKRKEISATFQSAFAEMSTLTSQDTEKKTKMQEENLEMRENIRSVKERIELSEKQLEKVRQQAQLELQLAEAKMAKVKMEMTAEKETLLKEKQQLLLKLKEYQVRIQELQATEVGLRSQISMYAEKYDDFQKALTKNNKVFSGFNEEMEKVTKKIIKLEKETNLWKQRWEKSRAALLEMAADKTARDAEMAKLNHKLSLLQELCKAFQRERAELMAQLRAHQHEPLQINKVDIQQVEELSKDCQELKENLVHLQYSLAEAIREGENDHNEISQETDKNLLSKNEEKIHDKNHKTENKIEDNKANESVESNEIQIVVEKLDEIQANDREIMTKEKIPSQAQSERADSQLTEDVEKEETAIVQLAESNCVNQSEVEGSSCQRNTQAEHHHEQVKKETQKTEEKEEEEEQLLKEQKQMENKKQQIVEADEDEIEGQSNEPSLGQSNEQPKSNKKVKDGKKKKK